MIGFKKKPIEKYKEKPLHEARAFMVSEAEDYPLIR